MNSYQVINKDYFYNDVIAIIYAISIDRAIELCEQNNIDFYHYEVDLHIKNIKNELGKPYYEKFQFLNN